MLPIINYYKKVTKENVFEKLKIAIYVCVRRSIELLLHVKT